MYFKAKIKFMDLIGVIPPKEELDKFRSRSSKEMVLLINPNLLFMDNEFININSKSSIDKLKNSMIFNKRSIKELVSEGYCKICHRNEAEYFSKDTQFKQLCVAAFIHSEDAVAFLRLNKRRPSDPEKLTLMQGHVTFPNNDFNLTLFELIKKNFRKELREEISPYATISNKVLDRKIEGECAFLEINSLPLCDKHIGIVFNFKENDLIYKLKSNERFKHWVYTFLKKDMHNYYNLYDSWALSSISIFRDEIQKFYKDEVGGNDGK